MTDQIPRDKKSEGGPPVQMVLGGLSFEVGRNGFDRLEENLSYKWTVLEKARNFPAMQFQTAEPRTIKISGTLDTRRSGLVTFDDIKQKAAKGEILTLTDGRGNVHGRFVVESINESKTSLFLEGVPRIINFDVSLKECITFGKSLL